MAVRMHISGAIDLFDLPSKSLENLLKTFRLRDPEFERLRRARWNTEGVREYRSYAEELPSGALRLPRGAYDLIVKELERDGTEWVVEKDHRSVGQALSFVTGDLRTLHLRVYQERARQLLVEKEQGLVVLPCAGGKSRLGVAVLLTLARSTLILVPTNDLAEQWQKDLRAVGIEAGLVCGGKDQHNADVVITTEFSLLPRLEATPGLANKFGLFLVDEAHRVTAKVLSDCCRIVPARWKLGLTASFAREDGQGPAVAWAMGPVLLECTTRELAALGVLKLAEIEFLPTTFSCEKARRAPAFRRGKIIEDELVTDADRTRLIAERVAIESGKGETTLVLTGRKEHAHDLGAVLLKSFGLSVPVLTSESRKKDRSGALDALRDGSLRAVIATSLADEGLNIERLSRLVLAFPSRAKSKTLQRVGRVMREFPGKTKPKVIDVVDPLVPVLEKRRQERVKVYKDLGLIA